MNRLIIVGAGGHGRVIADNALKNGYKDIFFVDDKSTGECIGFPIIGTTDNLEDFNDGKTDFIIGIGNNEIRKNISEKYNVNWVTIIHPSAIIGIDVSIGKGTVVMASAVINTSTSVGCHSIINTNAVVEHDNFIGSYTHISPAAALGGTVCIGEQVHIGIGAAISNNIKVCSNCVVGAGAVVVKDITKRGIYFGVPAREKRSGA